MPERPGRELLGEWRAVVESLLGSAASVPRSELAREVLRASQRQVELVQEAIERERALQGDLAGRLFGPLDALFDLLEETGASVRHQAEALAAAGAALEQAAVLMQRQAELFEQTIAALRQPAELAKAASGARRAASGAQRGRGEETGGKRAATGDPARDRPRRAAKQADAAKGASAAKRGGDAKRTGAAKRTGGTRRDA